MKNVWLNAPLIAANAKSLITNMFAFPAKDNMESYKLRIVWNVGRIADCVKLKHQQQQQIIPCSIAHISQNTQIYA